MSKNIEWHNEKRKVKDLIPADYNPRTIGEKEKADLIASIVEYGKVVPVVINTGKRNNVLIGGHRRVEIYADLGETEEEIEVRVPSRELTEAEERELNVRLNKNTGTWDFEKMVDNFDMEELTGWGFQEEELKTWFGLSESDGTEVDEERLAILTVLPPEAPMLKDKVAIKFKSKEDYDRVKNWIKKNGDKAAEDLLIKAAK